MEALNVYLSGRFAGVLSRDDAGRLSFRYDSEYLASGYEAISVTLPLSAEPYQERDIMAFFSNLLPDEGVRRTIAEILRLPFEDTFGILKEIGGDCAGAIAFWEAGKERAEEIREYKSLTEEESFKILTELDRRPLGIDDEFRGISGAGAQDKLIACLDGKVLKLPLKGTPSTHIIKPDIERFENSVFNEYFVMRLAKACGINVAKCDILTLKDRHFYVTERFDREVVNGRVTRLHQEDFCQLLKCRPEIKYQDQGGPSLVECVKLIRETLRLPAVDVLEFVDRVIFNFLVGNGDAHGKNFSVLYRNGQPRLSPAYDIISTTVYPAISKKMAMKFDGEYNFRWITKGKIVRTFERGGIGEKIVLASIAKMCARMKEVLPTFIDEVTAAHPCEIYHDIIRGIRARLSVLRD